MVKNQTNGLFWDGSSTEGGGGATCCLNTGAGGTSQLWTFTVNPDGTYRIINKASGLSLTDAGASKTSGTTLVQTKSDSDKDERWFITAVNNGVRMASAARRLAAMKHVAMLGIQHA
jgi:hypothetical protein